MMPSRSSRKSLFGSALAALLLCGCGGMFNSGTIRLTPGLVITKSVTVEADHYFIPGDSLMTIEIRGNGIIVDFNGAVLDGGYSGQAPDEFTGVGVRVDSSSDVTIKNAVIRGYKVAVLATDAPDFHLSGSDLSYNWRQRLKSSIERESQDDWMSYHQNENDEWMRYGAAVYLRRSDRARVDHIVVTGGHNGIMATEVNDALFYNNEITFNSAIGIGLYRSSGNRILHNRLDFNVRGHSPGVYNRGQDSAALLLYEQSSDNVIAYNSATHSGDGLFLWAGQSTMDTGSGGCNDNLIYGNDFSFAPTNGIEVTFSRNLIIGNRIEGCWHGIWGGYSFDTRIEGNEFKDNEEHIAIEHGQRNTIAQNQFTGGDAGLRIWERTSQPADWGYALNRDVASAEYLVSGNTFELVGTPLQISNTTDLQITGNAFTQRSEEVTTSVDAVFSDNTFEAAPSAGPSPSFSFEAPARMPDGREMSSDPDQPRGRNYMLIDEWGPYDFRSPVLWPRSRRTQREQIFELLGPTGKWRVVRAEGVEWLSRTSGDHTASVVPDTIRVRLAEQQAIDVNLEIEFIGTEITDRFGHKVEAGTPFLFSYSHFYLPVDWRVNFFNYDSRTDPRTAYPAFRKLIDGPSIFSERTDALSYQWYRAPAERVTADQFATVAEGTLFAPSGDYELDLTSDDGVRVWLDGILIHDDWTYHAPRQVTIPVSLNGPHNLRIEHFEIDGYATLMISFRRLN